MDVNIVNSVGFKALRTFDFENVWRFYGEGNSASSTFGRAEKYMYMLYVNRVELETIL